jgi:hypothetical protein
MNTCIKCGASCRHGRFRCDDCQTIVERQRGEPLPPPTLITDRFNPTKKRHTPMSDDQDVITNLNRIAAELDIDGEHAAAAEVRRSAARIAETLRQVTALNDALNL